MAGRTGGLAAPSTDANLADTVVELAQTPATTELPPCPGGQVRDPDEHCVTPGAPPEITRASATDLLPGLPAAGGDLPRLLVVPCHQTNDGNGDNVSVLPEGSFDGRRTWGNNPGSECARYQCVQMFPAPRR